MPLSFLPSGWTVDKLSAFNQLFDTAQTWFVVTQVRTLVGDTDPAVTALVANLRTLMVAQFQTFKSI